MLITLPPSTHDKQHANICRIGRGKPGSVHSRERACLINAHDVAGVWTRLVKRGLRPSTVGARGGAGRDGAGRGGTPKAFGARHAEAVAVVLLDSTNLQSPKRNLHGRGSCRSGRLLGSVNATSRADIDVLALSKLIHLRQAHHDGELCAHETRRSGNEADRCQTGMRRQRGRRQPPAAVHSGCVSHTA